MTDNKNIKEEQYEFESFQIFALLFRNKLFIILSTLVGIIASVIISLMLPNWYLAITNVVPPNDDDSGLGSAISGISSALREFGLSKLSGNSSGEAYTYLVILESRTVVDSMIHLYNLAETYDIPDTNLIDIRKEFSNNVEINYEKEGNYTISIWDKDPQRAAEMANKYVEIANSVAIRIAREEARMNTEYLEKRIAKIDSTIERLSDTLQRFSKKYMVFAFEDQAKAYAEAYSEMQAQQMQYDIMYDLYKNTYGETDPQTRDLKSIRDSWSAKLKNAEDDEGITGDFALRDAGEIGLSYMKNYVELETYAKVKAFLMPSLEEAKLKEVKNIRNLFIVDYAIPPNKKDKPKRSIIVLGAAFGSFALSIMMVFLVNSYRRFNSKYKQLYSDK